jgi:hypothetical protein
MNYVPPPDDPHIIGMDPVQFDAHLSVLLVVQNQFFNELLKKIVNLLRAEEECGLTLYQLKTKLGGLYTDDDIMLAIHKLRFNDPALVCRVGYDAVRYVLSIYIDCWAFVTKDVPLLNIDFLENSQDLEANKESQTVIAKKDTILPTLWTDINGSFTDVVLKGCKEIIVDIVLRKPGITESDLHRHLKGTLCRREIRDVLNILVEQRVLKQIQVSTPAESKKKSIFGKTKQILCNNANAIEELTQSCFWVTPSVYLNLT